MNDPFDNLSFEEEINPQRWASETRLHTPTFEALLKADGTLWLSGHALAEGFSVADAQSLTRFLSEHVQLPPVEPPLEEDLEDFSNVAPSTFLQIEEIQLPQKLPLLPTDYRAEEGDVYIQEFKAGRFMMHRYQDGQWTQWAALSAKEVQFFIEPMLCLGRTNSMRIYYRPVVRSALSYEEIETEIQEEYQRDYKQAEGEE